MRSHIILFSIIFCLFIAGDINTCASAINNIASPMSDARLKRIKLNSNIPFDNQVTKENTIYIISDDFDLQNKNVVIPHGCYLAFKGGTITNGILSGDFSVINNKSKKPIFEKIFLQNFEQPIKISWFVGDRKVLFDNDFKYLPEGAIVDFENIPFTIGETISITNTIDSLSFMNWVVSSSFPIKRWMISEYVGKCWNTSTHNDYIENVVWTDTVLPQEYVGYLIRIETADIVKYDDRDLTLFKGLMSVIISIEGKKVTIADPIEPFSTTRNYTLNNKKETLVSSFKIYHPVHLNLNKCNFTFTNRDACLTVDVYNSIIRNCSFDATNGASVLFNVTGHSIDIVDCTFKDAWTYSSKNYETEYGIQVNEGTRVNINNCTFNDNRRSVDFSGGIESRYCEVSNCSVYQKDYIGSGSALGGHSTSYGNIYRDNKLYGFYSAGIQCRGENEQVIGNEFYCRASGAMIISGINTTVEDNKVLSDNKYETDCFVYSTVDVPNNNLVIKNNVIRCRQQVVNVSSKKTSVTFIDNKVNLYTNSSDNQTFVFKYPPKVYLNNDIRTNSIKDVRIVEIMK